VTSVISLIIFTIICTGLLVIGAAGYFIIGYINDHGAKGIMDNVTPLIK
jgi:hypothetical protein